MTTSILSEDTSTLGQMVDTKMSTSATWLIRWACWTRQLEEQKGAMLSASLPLGKAGRPVLTRQ